MSTYKKKQLRAEGRSWPVRDFQQSKRVILLHRNVTASLRPKPDVYGYPSGYTGRQSE